MLALKGFLFFALRGSWSQHLGQGACLARAPPFVQKEPLELEYKVIMIALMTSIINRQFQTPLHLDGALI